jgi:hypothetical protein
MDAGNISSQIKTPGREIDSSPHPIIIYLFILPFLPLLSIPHPVQSLKTSGAINLVPHIPSGLAQGQICPDLTPSY